MAVAFDYASLIEQYGYVATFAGTVVEGETMLILSGLAAHRGYLSFAMVVLVGAVGGALGDMGFFLVGRHFGADLLARFPRFAPAADRVHAMIERNPSLTIFVVRFMYGLRTAGPAVIGTTRVPFVQFALLNALGALLWSACWAAGGYVAGEAAERVLGDLARIEREVFAVALVVVVVGAVAYNVWRTRARRSRQD